MSTCVRIGMLTAAVILVVGCSDSSKSNRPARKLPKKAESVAVADKASETGSLKVAQQIAYSYNPIGKRDPFRSPLLDEVRQAAGGNAPCAEPLCQWDLEQLTLTAVVTGSATPIAMVEDPRGAGHIVKRNSRIGKQGGRVTQILRDSITVTEYWADPTGKVIPKPTQKMIKEDRNPKPAMDLVSGKTFE